MTWSEFCKKTWMKNSNFIRLHIYPFDDEISKKERCLQYFASNRTFIFITKQS